MRLSGTILPLDRLSPSSLSMFASCPEQWRRKYLLKEPDYHSGSRFMGSVNHDVIAAILEAKRRGDQISELPIDEMTENVRFTYRSMWEQALDNQGEPHWNGDDPVEMYARGLQMALAYVEVVVPKITPLAVEERLELTLPGLPPIVGVVDVVEADKIRERKTTAQKQTKPKPRWRFQARVYQLITGMPVEWDVVTRQVNPKIYTAAEEPALRLELVSASATVSMITSMYDQMLNLIDRNGTETPWPQLGQFGAWDCDFCRYGPRNQADCPAWT